MLKDKVSNNQMPDKDAISVPEDHEISIILAFIDNNIESFFPYYNTIKDSDRENRTSDYLISHFEISNYEQSDGFIPYYFSRSPTQAGSDRETDIGVFPRVRKSKLAPVIEFEAKRLSATSNNKEYVTGEKGGIERFKKGQHTPHASICGMFGYVQSHTPEYWVQKINFWIAELAATNQDATIDWSGNGEKLTKVKSFIYGGKYTSYHTRKTMGKPIFIWHYLLDLTIQEVS
jgi:hypothetical protein